MAYALAAALGWWARRALLAELLPPECGRLPGAGRCAPGHDEQLLQGQGHDDLLGRCLGGVRRE
eukprot:12095306-Alexandrium_andersonii.AAC.1